MELVAKMFDFVTIEYGGDYTKLFKLVGHKDETQVYATGGNLEDAYDNLIYYGITYLIGE